MRNGRRTCVELPLEFEGKRAFVIWDRVSLGAYEFKTRLEIDPRLLRRPEQGKVEFVYSGKLELPIPQNN